MTNRRLITLLGSICLILILAALLFMTACPAPPEEMPTPPEEEKPTPPEEEKPVHEPITVSIAAGSKGGFAYTFAFATEELLAKKHPWLRARATQISSSTVIKNWYEDYSDTRTSLLTLGGAVSMWQGIHGTLPWQEGEKKYEDIQAICRLSDGRNVWLTLDPEIKTTADLVGHRFSPASTSAPTAMYTALKILEAYGISEDDLDITYLGVSDAKDALVDGRVDVIGSYFYYLRETDEYTFCSAMMELLEGRRPIYFVSQFDEGHKKKLEETVELPTFFYTIPPEAFGPKQPDAFGCFSMSQGLLVDKAVDEEVVYELTKFIWNNYKDYWPYHSKLRAVGPALMPTLWYTDRYHTGAMRFYEEVGAEIRGE